MTQVLLVNDNDEIKDRIATIVEDLGWEVYVADTEEFVFESLVASRPMMLIADVEMDGGIGFEAISTARRLYDDLFIIAVTRGRNQDLWSKIAASSGANDYVVGPISMGNLSAAIDQGFKSRLIEFQPYPKINHNS